ncbi:IS110 family transposase [Alicyclobacillus fastidiosus]|uniref:IS110 family transposase n=1 Tax=Alicyclobacillus fastidiosus TaxID=392011 RepID=A0ABY6ZJ11_9BACL|nr:IS110 family transposase [Alicyclobacillus fastidiosus]WAH42915.1 IS110 family transposase [Alicyclobacillus fastidiosus]GMA64859.1 IS110 family transposase [Alicyclobacillus fastidiosus]
MKDSTKFVGLDVSKDSIAVGIADIGRGAPRFFGTITNNPEAIRKLVRQLGNDVQLEFCYEAGPTGYGLYRQLTKMGLSCMVVAPSLIPVRQGDRVKTDRRDALRLAQLLRAGELTSVWVPQEDDEGLRDLVRTREDAKEDQLRTRHRLLKFLLRWGLRTPKGIRNWTPKHRKWLDTLQFTNRAQRMAFQEYLHQLDEIDGRIQRLEQEIHVQATDSFHAPVIQALQTLRGVAEVTATSLVAEIGQFSRFSNPRQLMAYAGLVPREYSSGANRWQGGITKTGNAHVRHILAESAWSYRYSPAIKGRIKQRQEGQSPQTQAIAWKAQDRLHRKYFRLISRGKNHSVAVTAVARELLGFIWAIGCMAERMRDKENTNSIA